jgi:hypothetical protein
VKRLVLAITVLLLPVGLPVLNSDMARASTPILATFRHLADWLRGVPFQRVFPSPCRSGSTRTAPLICRGRRSKMHRMIDHPSLPAPPRPSLQPWTVTFLVLAGLGLTLAPYLLPLYRLGPGHYVPALSLRLPARYLAAALLSDTPWSLVVGVALYWRGRRVIAAGMFIAAGIAQIVYQISLLVHDNVSGLRAWTGNALYLAAALSFLLAGAISARGAAEGKGRPSGRTSGSPLFLGLGWAMILVLAGTLVAFVFAFLPLFMTGSGYHNAFDGLAAHTLSTLLNSAGEAVVVLLLAAWGIAKDRPRFAAGVLLFVGLTKTYVLAWLLIYPQPVLGRPLIVIAIRALQIAIWGGAAAILLVRDTSHRAQNPALPIPSGAEAQESLQPH